MIKLIWLVGLVILLGGCATVVEDPLAALSATDSGPRVHLAAMEALDAADDTDEAYVAALEGALWRAGYTPEVREAAFRHLAEMDPEALKTTLRRKLPLMSAPEGRRRLCKLIAEAGWKDMSPTLVRSWGNRVPGVPDDRKRAEYLALVKLYGEEGVTDVLFDFVMNARKVSERGLRTRSWDLLTRLGERDRLTALIEAQPVDEDDAFLLDLKAAAVDFGFVPVNREEILWIRALRQPEHAAFWSEAVVAARELSPERRRRLEPRDLPLIVAAYRHDPSTLTRSNAELYDALAARLKGQKHYSHDSNFNEFNASRRERLYDWKGELTWGDLAAMTVALDALAVPEVVAHLFNYAERDRADESTEYGGVIDLDSQGRFEILEFPPRIREHDQKFIAPQTMLDAAYTAQFHFHYHAQRHNQRNYAGPGFGDVQYADALRANCLVFTFIDANRLNVDFYRHDRVLVDLGVVQLPPSPRG